LNNAPLTIERLETVGNFSFYFVDGSMGDVAAARLVLRVGWLTAM